MPTNDETKRPGLAARYRTLPPTVFALSFVAFLNDASSDIIYPLLPAFLALSLGGTPFAIGLIERFAESVAHGEIDILKRLLIVGLYGEDVEIDALGRTGLIEQAILVCLLQGPQDRVVMKWFEFEHVSVART
jgi:hypothetical protein